MKIPTLICSVGAAMVCCAAFSAHAQNAADASFVARNAPTVQASLDKDSIGIGDHFTFRVEVAKDLVQQIGFPVFEKGQFNDYIEILAELPPDTTAVDGRRVTIAKQYLLTTFEEGMHQFDSFPVLYMDKNIVDTLWATGPFRLEVGTFEIDTLTQTIYDIKLPVKAPFEVSEVAGYVLLGILILGLIAGGVYLWIRYRHRLPGFLAPRPKLPPHVVAIRALEALHHQKLWQNNKHKQYYTILTDILREYISGRYGVRAMEMTSDEIITAMRGFDLPAKLSADLTGLLSTADLVKFAKYVPDGDDNETVYFNAYYFVEETKEATETAIENPDDKPEPQVPDADAAPGDGKEVQS